MNKVLIIITTYQRPEKLKQLLIDIKVQSVSIKPEILIFEDYSNTSYSKTLSYANSNFRLLTWLKSSWHFGKTNYWQLIDTLYKAVKKRNFDYAIQLPDDITLVDDFFTKAINTYNSLPQSQTACLNILQDNRTSQAMWTPVNQEDFGNVYKTGWVDMCFIAKRNFFEALDFTIHEVCRSWSSNPNRSSGVGKQISERLYNKYNFYHVKQSLVLHGRHISVMHPRHRKDVPLITNEKTDRIVAGIASLPDRVLSLKQVVNSLINQVDELHIYLNGHTMVPEFLHHNKIKAYLSMNEIGDIGDIGKFYNVEKASGYFLSMDDDLIYPPDYVQKMINKIEQHKRKYVVSLHGRIFEHLPVHSYYHGHTKAYSCLNYIPHDVFVQVVGTGVLAFHTSTVKVKLSDFKATNMADIWFSKVCHRQNVNLLVMAHKNRWIKEATLHDDKHSIYFSCNKNEAMQTKIINETHWNHIPTHHP